jgi:hypothetical protein
MSSKENILFSIAHASPVSQETAHMVIAGVLDHPDTQAWKRAALRRAGLAEPANVWFVAADLSATVIGNLGIPARATWNWLGVTMYLQPQATAATLRAMKRRTCWARRGSAASSCSTPAGCGDRYLRDRHGCRDHAAPGARLVLTRRFCARRRCMWYAGR